MMRITLFLLCLLAAPTLTAQTLPEGPQRFWLELQIGASTQQPNCGGCLQPSRIGGPTATAALGATITQRVGVALLVREFDEFSLEESHSGKYLVGLGQYLLNPG
ncbi:MAG TPA: hypothetical protein VJN70_08705 [Gemmatimonadaceae bacterium]|nr:hypothetical protein [Gemmatimonadaceae bacterium]